MESRLFKPNKGKTLEINIGAETYLRLPVKTGLITDKDNLADLLKKYVAPHLQPNDIVFVSEKALTVTQGRIINMNDIKPSRLARFLARRVRNNFGIKGAFYFLCGKRAKSIDCPMSFSILEYAHYAKRAPLHPDKVAREIKEKLGREAVILDANYLGAFSLGKSTGKISEKFIGKLFMDNPLGQSDEMTPFCIVRKKS